MKLFTYTGPLDEVDLHVRVKRGEQIGVSDACAGRPYSEELDEDGEVVSRDLGEGLLAQPDTWRADTKELALADMTVAELEAHAAACDPPVDLSGLKKKAELVAAIQAAADSQEG